MTMLCTRVSFLACLLALGLSTPGLAAETLITFDDQIVGSAPKGMTCELAGKGKPGIWKILDNVGNGPGNKMVGQLGKHDREIRYPVCVVNGITAKDVDISVSFMPISGSTDQAAGIVFRYQDKKNFYVVRANALEDNVVPYRMKRGRRRNIAQLLADGSADTTYGSSAPVPRGKWNTMKVSVRGDLFTVFINGKKIFTATDKLFRKAGRVGIWTKADSVIHFDDLKVVTQDALGPAPLAPAKLP